jgi:hypothetical protein
MKPVLVVSSLSTMDDVYAVLYKKNAVRNAPMTWTIAGKEARRHSKRVPNVPDVIEHTYSYNLSHCHKTIRTA